MHIFDTFLTDLRAKIAVYGVAKMRIYRHAYRGPQSMAGVLLGLGVGLGLGIGLGLGLGLGVGFGLGD